MSNRKRMIWISASVVGIGVFVTGGFAGRELAPTMDTSRFSKRIDQIHNQRRAEEAILLGEHDQQKKRMKIEHEQQLQLAAESHARELERMRDQFKARTP